MNNEQFGNAMKLLNPGIIRNRRSSWQQERGRFIFRQRKK